MQSSISSWSLPHMIMEEVYTSCTLNGSIFQTFSKKKEKNTTKKPTSRKTPLLFSSWYLRKTNWDIWAYEWLLKKYIFPKNAKLWIFYYSMWPFTFFIRNICKDYLISFIGMCWLVLIHSKPGFCVWLRWWTKKFCQVSSFFAPTYTCLSNQYISE